MTADNHILFVLGAGASKAARETPLGNELIWNYIQDTNLFSVINDDGSVDNSMDDDKNEYFEIFLEKIAHYFPQKAYLYTNYKNRRMDLFMPEIEEKALFADELLRFAQKKRDFDFCEVIRRLIYQHINEKHTVIMDPIDDLYDQFTEYLLKNISADVISLNFDTLLREIYIDGHIYTFDYVIPFSEDRRKSSYKNEIHIGKMIKLHGSFDWRYCKTCRKMILTEQFQRYDNYESEKCYICKSVLKPYFIVPYDDNITRINEKLILKAEKLINNASKIIVIGYSFPDYDNDIIDLFSKNVNNKMMLNIIEYADNKETVQRIQRRMQKIFPDKNIQYYFNGFKNWLKKEMTLLDKEKQ